MLRTTLRIVWLRLPAFNSEKPTSPAVMTPTLETAIMPAARDTRAVIKSIRTATQRLQLYVACAAWHHTSSLSAKSLPNCSGMSDLARMTARPAKVPENCVKIGDCEDETN